MLNISVRSYIMKDLQLNNISDNLYILLLSLNRQIFNPNDLTK